MTPAGRNTVLNGTHLWLLEEAGESRGARGGRARHGQRLGPLGGGETRVQSPVVAEALVVPVNRLEMVSQQLLLSGCLFR